jgi:hypothetical protein
VGWICKGILFTTSCRASTLLAAPPKQIQTEPKTYMGDPGWEQTYTPDLTLMSTRSKVFTAPPRDEEDPGSEGAIMTQNTACLSPEWGVICLKKIYACACSTLGVEARKQPWFSFLRHYLPFYFFFFFFFFFCVFRFHLLISSIKDILNTSDTTEYFSSSIKKWHSQTF